MSKEKSKKKDVEPSEKREIATTGKIRRPTVMAPYSPPDVWRNFDRIFDRFRTDFEDMFWPERSLARAFPMMPTFEGRVPFVDLEDRGKDFFLTAEMPGFKKEDIDLQVMDDSIEIKAASKWKYDDKTKNYIHRERATESFYRRIELPEEINTDKVEANLKDGVLELILPKKMPKPRKKVAVK